LEDERRSHFLLEKRMGQEVELSSIGPEFAGVTARISGGNDKQGECLPPFDWRDSPEVGVESCCF
jgi:ribosomal protein S6E (S10)